MKLTLLLAAWLPVVVLAREAEDAGRTEFSFRVRKSTATVRVLMDGGAAAQRLVISFSDPQVPEQVVQGDDLDGMQSGLGPKNDLGFSAADYDGDGCTDFSFVDATGRPADHTGCYFFYRPGKRRFERRRDFDAAGLVDYDPRTRLFSSSGREGAVFYRFEHGHFRLVRRVARGYADAFRDILPHAPDSAEYVVTTLYLPDGRLRRFYRHVGKD